MLDAASDISSNDVAIGVDPKGPGQRRERKINRCEFAVGRAEEAMNLVGLVLVPTHNVALCVNVTRQSSLDARDRIIERCNYTIAEDVGASSRWGDTGV